MSSSDQMAEESDENHYEQLDETEDSDEDDRNLIRKSQDGSFALFLDLLTRPAHLAVFVLFVISQLRKPASLLFFLISEEYTKTTSTAVKEIKRWIYEIHSCFLAPHAPLRVTELTNEIVKDIDDALLDDRVSDVSLRHVFAPARDVAVTEIDRQLIEFNRKRDLGLGNMFMEELAEQVDLTDKAKQLSIMETIFMMQFERTLDSAQPESERLNPTDTVILWSLATLLRAAMPKLSLAQNERQID